MRTIEKNVYTFDELSDDVKNKLIEERKKGIFECYMEFSFYDDMVDKAGEILKDYFGKDSEFVNTYYSLSYCQGDGAMIEFDINIVDLNNKYKVFSDEEIRYINDKGIVNDIKVRHHDNFYYNEYTFIIDYDYYNDYDFEDIENEYKISKEEFETIDDRFYNLVDYSNKHYTNSEFVKDIISMNKELSNYGYDVMENYEEDTDFIIEQLCEDEYYENGEMC